MKINKIEIAIVVLTLHAANSYILLTANVEDVHALAKQIAASPVASQLSKIIRRATDIFNEQYNKAASSGNSEKIQMRTDPKLDEAPRDKGSFEVWKPDEKEIAGELEASGDSSASEISAEANEIKPHKIERRHQVGPDLVELGKNASFYLKSIKKIFENV